jgi:hypothetical protein
LEERSKYLKLFLLCQLQEMSLGEDGNGKFHNTTQLLQNDVEDLGDIIGVVGGCNAVLLGNVY